MASKARSEQRLRWPGLLSAAEFQRVWRLTQALLGQADARTVESLQTRRGKILTQAWRRYLPEARAISDAAVQPLADAIGLPLGEVLAAPLGARMALVAHARGAATQHLELSHSVKWKRAWLAGFSNLDQAASGWTAQGTWTTPKYATFMQEDAFATFDPKYSSKWGLHELLHRAEGFCFWPTMAPFDLYLAARLSELLPVATWYGLEQAGRLRDHVRMGRFDTAHAGRFPEARRQDARWRTPHASRSNVVGLEWQAVARVAFYFDHTARELAAIEGEMRSRVPIEVLHPEEPHLNAHSDAWTYAVAHTRRLRDPQVAAVLMQQPAWLRASSLSSFARRVRALLRELVVGHLDFDAQAFARKKSVRTQWQTQTSARGPIPIVEALGFFPQASTRFGMRAVRAVLAAFARAHQAPSTWSRTDVLTRLLNWFHDSAVMDPCKEAMRFELILHHVEHSSVTPELPAQRKVRPQKMKNRPKFPRKQAKLICEVAPGFAQHRFGIDVLTWMDSGVVQLRTQVLVLGKNTDGDIKIVELDASSERVWERYRTPTLVASKDAALVTSWLRAGVLRSAARS